MENYAALGLVFLVVLLFIGPVLTITALNVLFGLAIPITIGTWFATFWLCLLFTPGKFTKTSN